MTNPSTVWTQLSLGLSPVGSLPFVDTDGVTVITDVGNYKYSGNGVSGSSGSDRSAFQLSVRGGIRVGLQDSAALVQLNYVQNQVAGRVTIPAGQKVVVIQNPQYVYANSLIIPLVETDDATLKSAVVTGHGDGTFSLTGNANATGNTVVKYLIVNVM